MTQNLANVVLADNNAGCRRRDCVLTLGVCVVQPVNTFVITARECSRALTDIRNREQPGLRSHLRGKLDEWHVEYRVTLLRVASWWAIKWVSLASVMQVLTLLRFAQQMH